MNFNWKAVKQAAFRFSIYGALCIAGEVAFVTVVRIGQKAPSFINWMFQYSWVPDPRIGLDHIWNAPLIGLYGQASLWMFIVYGTGGLFGLEFAYNKIKGWPWIVRGAIYMAIIMFIECVWGWVLFLILGYEIWYYRGTLTLFRFTSLAAAPMWFMVGLVCENIIRIVERVAEQEV